jgi:hypothetical protein
LEFSNRPISGKILRHAFLNFSFNYISSWQVAYHHFDWIFDYLKCFVKINGCVLLDMHGVF